MAESVSVSAASVAAVSAETNGFGDEIPQVTAPPIVDVRRCRITTTTQLPERLTRGVIYWMHREIRMCDNWSLLRAQQLAMLNRVPLYILYVQPEKYLDNTFRHFAFALRG